MLNVIFENLMLLISTIGVICIIIWLIRAIFAFVKSEIDKWDLLSLHDKIRSLLGSYILLWMDFIIIADIIGSVIHTWMEKLYELWIIVIIRIAIAYFLSKEIKEIEEHQSKRNLKNKK